MQGRRDEVSIQFYENAMAVVKRALGSILPPPASALDGVLLNAEVNNRTDRRMVIEVLSFSAGLADPTIVAAAVAAIERRRVCSFTRRLDEISDIGEKLAAQFLRDFMTVYGLESRSDPDDKEPRPTVSWRLSPAFRGVTAPFVAWRRLRRFSTFVVLPTDSVAGVRGRRSRTTHGFSMQCSGSNEWTGPNRPQAALLPRPLHPD